MRPLLAARSGGAGALRVLVVLLVGAVILLGGGRADAVTSSYADEVLADSPVGYWRLGETSGTAAADSSPNGLGGVYTNGVALGVGGALNGDPNAAVRFDGTNDLVTMGDPASGALDFGASDFTVEAWVATTDITDRTIVGKKTSGSSWWQVTVTDDAGHEGRIRAQIRAGSTRTAYSLGRVDDGAWHHVVVRVDRDSGISFFVDGVASGSKAGPDMA